MTGNRVFPVDPQNPAQDAEQKRRNDEQAWDRKICAEIINKFIQDAKAHQIKLKDAVDMTMVQSAMPVFSSDAFTYRDNPLDAPPEANPTPQTLGTGSTTSLPPVNVELREGTVDVRGLGDGLSLRVKKNDDGSFDVSVDGKMTYENMSKAIGAQVGFLASKGCKEQLINLPYDPDNKKLGGAGAAWRNEREAFGWFKAQMDCYFAAAKQYGVAIEPSQMTKDSLAKMKSSPDPIIREYVDSVLNRFEDIKKVDSVITNEIAVMAEYAVKDSNGKNRFDTLKEGFETRFANVKQGLAEFHGKPATDTTPEIIASDDDKTLKIAVNDVFGLDEQGRSKLEDKGDGKGGLLANDPKVVAEKQQASEKAEHRILAELKEIENRLQKLETGVSAVKNGSDEKSTVDVGLMATATTSGSVKSQEGLVEAMIDQCKVVEEVLKRRIEDLGEQRKALQELDGTVSDANKEKVKKLDEKITSLTEKQNEAKNYAKTDGKLEALKTSMDAMPGQVQAAAQQRAQAQQQSQSKSGGPGK